MKPRLNTSTTTGSTFSPGLSSVYNLSIVPLEPPAPAALVLVGRAFLTVSLWSAAARRRIAERGPPGGELARAMLDVVVALPEGVEESGPDSGPEVKGEDGRGEAFGCSVSDCGREKCPLAPAHVRGTALRRTSHAQTLESVTIYE